MILENASTENVILYDDFLLNAEAQDITYLLSLDPERFLHNWYITSGLTPTRDGYEESWERTTDKNFKGHMFGHYMVSLSQAYKASKNKELKAQLLEKIKACINGIRLCQNTYAAKYPDRAGYAAPFSEYWLNDKDNVDTGSEPWNQREENSETYVPWYNLHKVIAGLIAVYRNVSDDAVSETALKLVCDFADYVYRCRVAKYTDIQKKNMLSTEYGGMPEVLYELYHITGKPEYKICADGFIETDLFKNLAENKDVLDGLHANTTIPKLIGSLKKYTVLTQNENYYNALSDAEKEALSMYYDAAVNFFDIVLRGHSYVTGGNSVNEHFRAANTISTFCQNPETHETCNEYNMLKLARELFRLTGDKKYADYYENTFINAILASQNPKTGEMTYFQPMGTGYSKIFNKTRFWCCSGTGTESFTKLGDSIYFTNGDRVYVNMYFSSEMAYRERNLTLKMDAHLPNSDTVSITAGGDIISKTTLYLRIPNWCACPSVSRNGSAVDYTTDNGYIVIADLTDGDRLDLRLPMEVSISELHDNKNVAAFRYGPVVLAAKMNQNHVKEAADTGIMVLRAVQDSSLSAAIPLADTDVEAWKKNIKHNLVRIADTEDGFVQFKLNGTALPDDMVFVPYYSIYKHRYGLYLSLSPAGSGKIQPKNSYRL